jgi:phage head maturation protease
MTLTVPTPVELEECVRTIPSADYDIDRVRGVVEALIVPWNRPTDITEVIRTASGPEVVDYREQFAPGALARAQAAPRRVGLTFTHSHAMPDRMGYGTELRDSAEGAVMVWQLYRDTLDRSIELLTTTHDGMSLTFRAVVPAHGTERPGELVTRESVHLISVAATDDPAYVDTRVLAIRERQAQLDAEAEALKVRAAQHVEGLLLLRKYGRELTPAECAYLAEYGHPAPV